MWFRTEGRAEEQILFYIIHTFITVRTGKITETPQYNSIQLNITTNFKVTEVKLTPLSKTLSTQTQYYITLQSAGAPLVQILVSSIHLKTKRQKLNTL